MSPLRLFLPISSRARVRRVWPVGSALVFLLLATGPVCLPAAQPAGGGTSAAADGAWSQVSALRQAAGAVKAPKSVGLVAASRAEAERRQSEREGRAQKFRETAAAARDFYSRHPNHPQAAEARKLEVLANLEGSLPRDLAHERATVAAVAAFRSDPAHPVSDRWEVAQAFECREITRQTLGRPWFAHQPRAETMLDQLRAEFGDRPEVWSGFLALALNADCDAGREAAYRVVQADAAPEPTKVAARRVLERYALVREPLDFPLQSVDGRATRLADLAGRTTVVCFWDGTRQPGGPPGLHDFRKNPRPDTHWVYISVGEPGPLPRGARPPARPAGTVSVEPLGWKSPLVERLRLTQLPYVFVLDGQRKLSGYGRPDEIPALLAGLGRPALP